MCSTTAITKLTADNRNALVGKLRTQDKLRGEELQSSHEKGSTRNCEEYSEAKNAKNANRAQTTMKSTDEIGTMRALVTKETANDGLQL